MQSLLASAFFEEKKKKKKAAKEVKKTNKGKEEAIKHSHNKISQFTSLSAPFLHKFLWFRAMRDPDLTNNPVCCKARQMDCFRHGDVSPSLQFETNLFACRHFHLSLFTGRCSKENKNGINQEAKYQLPLNNSSVTGN